MPKTGPQPLSWIEDGKGHRIERYPGDVLVITDKLTGKELAPAERAIVEAWYWNTPVGLHGNDPGIGNKD